MVSDLGCISIPFLRNRILGTPPLYPRGYGVKLISPPLASWPPTGPNSLGPRLRTQIWVLKLTAQLSLAYPLKSGGFGTLAPVVAEFYFFDCAARVGCQIGSPSPQLPKYLPLFFLRGSFPIWRIWYPFPFCPLSLFYCPIWACWVSI